MPDGTTYIQNVDGTYSLQTSSIGEGQEVPPISNAAVALGLRSANMEGVTPLQQQLGPSQGSAAGAGGAPGQVGQTRLFGQDVPIVNQGQQLAEGAFLGTPIFGSNLPASAAGIGEAGGLYPNLATILPTDQGSYNPVNQFGGYQIDERTGQPVGIGVGYNPAAIYGAQVAQSFPGGMTQYGYIPPGRDPAAYAAARGWVQQNSPEYYALLGITQQGAAAAALGAVGQQNLAAQTPQQPGVATSPSQAQTVSQQAVEQTQGGGNISSESSQANTQVPLAIRMGWGPTDYSVPGFEEGGTIYGPGTQVDIQPVARGGMRRGPALRGQAYRGGSAELTAASVSPAMQAYRGGNAELTAAPPIEGNWRGGSADAIAYQTNGRPTVVSINGRPAGVVSETGSNEQVRVSSRNPASAGGSNTGTYSGRSATNVAGGRENIDWLISQGYRLVDGQWVQMYPPRQSIFGNTSQAVGMNSAAAVRAPAVA